MIFTMFMPYNDSNMWDIRKKDNLRAHLHNIALRMCISRFNVMPRYTHTTLNKSTHRMQPFSLERVPWP